MSWVSELVEGSNTPVSLPVKWAGEEREGFFRRITAAERQQLLAGQRVAHKHGEAEMDIELGANEKTKQMMVLFATVNADNSRAFSSLKEVSAIPAGLMNVLFKCASQVNKDEAEDETKKD